MTDQRVPRRQVEAPHVGLEEDRHERLTECLAGRTMHLPVGVEDEPLSWHPAEKFLGPRDAIVVAGIFCGHSR